jgi:hypothetical protein
LVGSWLATVEGDPSTRTLVITAEAPTDSGALLNARYGVTGKGITPIEANMSRVANRRQMNLVTQAATNITVTEQADGTFAGTFSQKNGIVKNVVFTRVSEAELVQSLSTSKSQSTTVGPNLGGPKIVVGDTWQYQFKNEKYAKPGCVYSLTVEEIKNANVYARVNYPEGCEVSITTSYPVPSNSLQKYDLDFNHFHFSSSPYKAFAFPLEVGKKWVQEFQWKLNGWTYNDEINGTIEKMEEVTTPAGTFYAFKIVLKRKYQGTKPGNYTQAGVLDDTWWYAPEVKNFVRREYKDSGWAHIVRELVKYDVSK